MDGTCSNAATGIMHNKVELEKWQFSPFIFV